MNVEVYSYDNAHYMGDIDISKEDYDMYINSTHPLCQWPEGLFRLGDWFTPLKTDELRTPPGVHRRDIGNVVVYFVV